MCQQVQFFAESPSDSFPHTVWHTQLSTTSAKTNFQTHFWVIYGLSWAILGPLLNCEKSFIWYKFIITNHCYWNIFHKDIKYDPMQMCEFMKGWYLGLKYWHFEIQRFWRRSDRYLRKFSFTFLWYLWIKESRFLLFDICDRLLFYSNSARESSRSPVSKFKLQYTNKYVFFLRKNYQIQDVFCDWCPPKR